MSLLDKDFWIELLADVHYLVADGGHDVDWKEWATSKIAKTRESAEEIPVESIPEVGDEAVLDRIASDLRISPITPEADALDQIWHGLDNGSIEFSRKRMEDIFFLLYRLQEGFGP